MIYFNILNISMNCIIYNMEEIKLAKYEVDAKDIIIQLLKQKISLIEQNELKNKKIDLLQSKINDYERRLSLCQR